MQRTITRLALFQCLTILYSVLFVGLLVKISLGSPAPPIFATHLRDYGFLLLALPFAWLVWACRSANQPLPGTGELGPILVSGFLLLAILMCVAVIGTMSAIVSGSSARHPPPPSPATHSP